jgi:hypothetical protein
MTNFLYGISVFQYNMTQEQHFELLLPRKVPSHLESAVKLTPHFAEIQMAG